MLQQVMVEPGVIHFNEVEVPKPLKGQVLIKIVKIGICGSDIHVYYGKHPFTKYPITQGHEASGQIVEIGEGVVGFEVDQRVTIQPQIVCGNCYPCLHGKYNLCEELKVYGFQTTGVGSHYFVEDVCKVTALPDGVSYDEGAMIEPLAVAVHAIKQAGNVQGCNVVVLGAGPIGNLVAQTAKGMGASNVMITDISDYKLEMASKCNIDICINTKTTDLEESVLEHFGTDRADVIYDCAGNNITMNQAIKSARKGSTIILVAVFATMAEIDLALVMDHELCIQSSFMYRAEDYIEAIELVEKNKVTLETIVSKHFSFKDFKKAYEYIDTHRKETMKIIIDVQDVKKQ